MKLYDTSMKMVEIGIEYAQVKKNYLEKMLGIYERDNDKDHTKDIAKDSKELEEQKLILERFDIIKKRLFVYKSVEKGNVIGTTVGIRYGYPKEKNDHDEVICGEYTGKGPELNLCDDPWLTIPVGPHMALSLRSGSVNETGAIVINADDNSTTFLGEKKANENIKKLYNQTKKWGFAWGYSPCSFQRVREQATARVNGVKKWYEIGLSDSMD
jgi:hypothetical protein